ncbi:MAG: VanZ family protein [Candidatus Dojkabacteria bacterium]|uniref:VanZ like family protein n=2 Tax=Candidatus Dojkabacteria TaxID=74243 RepID=A0A136KJG9_9BACT|nr:MAG: VanZ like family protein [candidate division WS6 bacterium OLB21]MBW7953198.1 VanZ family protein [Candidatus Dojkabacteria bacterium]WKZ28344.1 MAG: VanZ family protein [Candidatus Dojkabacteria bacterium]
MNNKLFLTYCWITSFAWFGLILILSTIPDLDTKGNQIDWLVRGVGYALMYAIMFLLILRSLLASARSKVKRLAYYKSRRERSEDVEFALLTEFLLFVIAVLITIILSVIDEYLQSQVVGRVAAVSDILINILGIVIASTLVYKIPLLTEAEDILLKKHK